MPDSGAGFLPTDAPDWSTISREILCPLCDYNLRGLTEPRCPECGYGFEWRTVFDLTARHPYVFDQQTHRPARSFFRTCGASQRPGRFWSFIFPTQPTSAARLRIYILLVTAPLLLIWLGWLVVQGHELYQHNQAMRNKITGWVAGGWTFTGSLSEYLDTNYPLPPSWRFFRNLELTAGVGVKITFMLMAWPWMTYATLRSFRVSWRRLNIRSAHVLRCVAYSFDALLWLPPLLAIICLPKLQMSLQPLLDGLHPIVSDALPGSDIEPYDILMLAASLLLMLVIGYRLNVALRNYLRLGHTPAVVAASQVILILLAWIVLLAVN